MPTTREVEAARIERMRRAQEQREGVEPMLASRYAAPAKTAVSTRDHDARMATGDHATKPWRLKAYAALGADAKPRSVTVHTGDAALNAAVLALDAAPTCRRYSIHPA